MTWKGLCDKVGFFSLHRKSRGVHHDMTVAAAFFNYHDAKAALWLL